MSLVRSRSWPSPSPSTLATSAPSCVIASVAVAATTGARTVRVAALRAVLGRRWRRRRRRRRRIHLDVCTEVATKSSRATARDRRRCLHAAAVATARGRAGHGADAAVLTRGCSTWIWRMEASRRACACNNREGTVSVALPPPAVPPHPRLGLRPVPGTVHTAVGLAGRRPSGAAVLIPSNRVDAHDGKVCSAATVHEGAATGHLPA